MKARARDAIYTSVMSAWSGALPVNIEKITPPSTPSGGPAGGSGIPYVSYAFSTGGSTSNIGDPVQYLFDWGDGTNSGWLTPGTGNTVSASHSWQTGGKFTVTVKARCATHTYIESVPSGGLEVDIETVTAPTQPVLTGNPVPTLPYLINMDYTFQTGGALSNLGHPVEYQFDWGDGTPSLWITPDAGGTASATHQWGQSGTKSIRARARCKTDTGAVSDWSSTLSFVIP